MTVIPAAYIAAGSVDTVLTGVEGTLATYGFMLAYGLVALATPIYLAKLNEGKAIAWWNLRTFLNDVSFNPATGSATRHPPPAAAHCCRNSSPAPRPTRQSPTRGVSARRPLHCPVYGL
jgi:hypothetical protein